MRSLLAAVMITLAAQACAAPGWVQRGTGVHIVGAGEEVLDGVGSSSGITDPGLARATSDNRAREALSGVWQSYVDAFSRAYGADGEVTDDGVTVFDVKTFTVEVMMSSQIVAHHHDDGTLYSLARVSFSDLVGRIRSMNALDAQQIAKLTKAARAAFDALEPR